MANDDLQQRLVAVWGDYNQVSEQLQAAMKAHREAGGKLQEIDALYKRAQVLSAEYTRLTNDSRPTLTDLALVVCAGGYWPIDISAGVLRRRLNPMRTKPTTTFLRLIPIVNLHPHPTTRPPTAPRLGTHPPTIHPPTAPAPPPTLHPPTVPTAHPPTPHL